MRLEYISHSCFLLELEGTHVAFDPWITGSAYNGQWHLFPKPHDISGVVNSDLVLISHGHEDHLHQESLGKITRAAHIFFPFQWRAGVRGYLNGLGFKKITESISFRTYTFENLKITYLGYSLESVIVVEGEGHVIVNINDALNSNHETAVSFLLDKIKERWPKIDFLLSGWSGAGYFPNKVHYKGKNDFEVAQLREQYFANNFCRFTEYLQPETAIAFAPGFVLLTDENRWINDVKFPRENLSSYFNSHYKAERPISFPIMYPGDYFSGKSLVSTSPYHSYSSDQEIYKNVNGIFHEEIIIANTVAPVDEFKVEVLMQKLRVNIAKRIKLYHAEVIEDAVFSVRLKDVALNEYLNVAVREGIIRIERNNIKSSGDRLIITTRASLLLESLERQWGGDLLTIGYGIDVEVFDELSLEKNLDIVCVGLISRYPQFKDDMVRHAGIIAKYYLNNPLLTNLWIKQKLKLRPYINKYPFNERDHWITYNKCDLCKVCKMPEVEFETIN